MSLNGSYRFVAINDSNDTEDEEEAITTENNTPLFLNNASAASATTAPAKKWWCSWSVIRYYVIPVELVSLLFMFTMSFSIQLTQQYFFQNIFRADIEAISNRTIKGCLNEDAITNTNLTGLDLNAFIKGQEKINNYNTGSTLLYLFPSVFMTILTGPISDYYGRKPFLVLVVLGHVLSTVVGLLITYYDLNILVFFLGSFVAGSLGGIGAMLSLTFSYVSDITPKSWLTVRMGMLEASLFLGVAASAGIADTLIDQMKCDFTVPMWVMFSTSVIALVICVLLPESLSKEAKSSSAKGFKVLARGMKLLFWKSYLSKHLWQIWLSIIIMIISFFNITGITQVILYFLHNKPLKWNYTIIGIYQTISSTFHLLVLVIVLPLLVIYKVPDIFISLIGSTVACATCVFIALLTKTWEMFLAGIIIGFEVLVAPGLRARIARIIDRNDVGAIFSVIAVLQILASLVAVIVFDEVYSPGSTRGRNPRVIFWLACGTWAVASIILLVIFFTSERNFKKEKKRFFVNKNIFSRNKYGGTSSS